MSRSGQTTLLHAALLPVLSLVLLLIPAGVLAQTRDGHMADRAGELFLASPFAHGYIHGYEDGFHNGNLDYQEGRKARALKDFREYRLAKAGYQDAFGDIGAFRSGYRSGFAAGYSDGVSGREFRGMAAVRVAAQALPGDAVADITANGGFDMGFGDGYALGLIAGKRAGAADDEFDATNRMCGPESPEIRAHPRSYCEGFTRAYSLGYRDGYLSPPLDRSITVAIAGSR